MYQHSCCQLRDLEVLKCGDIRGYVAKIDPYEIPKHGSHFPESQFRDNGYDSQRIFFLNWCVVVVKSQESGTLFWKIPKFGYLFFERLPPWTYVWVLSWHIPDKSKSGYRPAQNSARKHRHATTHIGSPSRDLKLLTGCFILVGSSMFGATFILVTRVELP